MTTRKGKLGKVECPHCPNHGRKTEAQLREYGPDYCAPCTDLSGYPVRMVCPDPAWHEITPQGRAEALAEALAADGARLEREAVKVRREAYPQLRCEGCGALCTKERSAELIDTWQRIEGQGWDGDSLILRIPDYGTGMEWCHPSCECGHDRFVRMRTRGKRIEREAVPF
jgi:hypothetical protein